MHMNQSRGSDVTRWDVHACASANVVCVFAVLNAHVVQAHAHTRNACKGVLAPLRASACYNEESMQARLASPQGGAWCPLRALRGAMPS